MVAKASYEREITVRERLNKNITVRERLNTNRFVVGIIKDSDSEYLRNNLVNEAKRWTRFNLQGYPYGIVMDAADRNLAVIELQERPDLDKVILIMQQVALAL